MFNVMLDSFPDEWQGYKLNTDFRIGIMIALATSDNSLSDEEKSIVVLNLLFEDDYPESTQEIGECIEWFMNGWATDHFKKSGGVEVMNFDADQGRIYSAFLMQYKIDLNIEDMHFWKFMLLLTNLEECTFTRVIDIRAKKLDSKMNKEERKYYVEAKKMYSITRENIKTEEEKEAEREVTETFLNYIGGN